MKIAISCLLCALVCTAIAYPAEKQTLEEEVAQAELFNRLRSAFKNIRTKIGRKFGALKNRLCGITPAASESQNSLEPAFAMEDAQIEAFAEAILQSLQNGAEMEEEVAQAELFNRLRSAFKNIRTKIGGKFSALKNRLCGITPAASESQNSLEPAFAMEYAQIEAILQSLQNEAEMEKWLNTLKE